LQKTRYLEELIYHRQFRFDRLVITGIDNEAVARRVSPEILCEECCLFANTVSSGDQYFQLLHQRLAAALQNRLAFPVVRFADGEYAFYRLSLECNGLYRQAESAETIRKVIPEHLMALEALARDGLFAPLVFPGNCQRPPENLFFFKKKKHDCTAADFLDFLLEHGIRLTPDNYIPFYAVYAYLSSPEFAAAVDGRNLCILNSDLNETNCRNWFGQLNSQPALTFVEIPREYVATRWEKIKKDILSQINSKTDLCLVGAGVGALMICQDVAEKFSVPALDAGHVLNMMNSRLDKSNGARLYTIRKSG